MDRSEAVLALVSSDTLCTSARPDCTLEQRLGYSTLVSLCTWTGSVVGCDCTEGMLITSDGLVRAIMV